ncbi:MFS transporter [Cupriavidus sp. SK-4]|uniref:MFS transporter n=1 Tax=Cupriavidus sp. SK-4 TaxID=574750 RepID=UPI000452B26D|nr:MFS transporter [Cupriavidus sp. SK-4]EYS91611.1 MFS transporter [Cupriavidus sp. SK-4]
MAVSIQQTPIDATLPDLEKRTYDKVFWRTVPLFFVCYVISYLDRVNIGFAKLQMLGDLDLTDNVYALAASMLFWGYVLFEMPSNLILHRVGARRWISRIMISWGCVSVSMMYIEPLAAVFHTSSATMFYVLRFLLGVCEAGFFPGVVLYLNQWFPSHKQNRVLAGFMFALPLSLCIGGPVSGWILQNMHDTFGHRGWQWMLLVEGLPAVILGIVVLACLTDSVDKARWLNADEKALIKRNLATENAHKTHNFGAALKSPVIWLLCAILLTMNTGFYGLSFWLPSIIQATGLKNVYHVGLLSALPYVVAGVVLVANAMHSNRTGERRLHAAIPAACAGIGLILSAACADQLGPSLLLISVAAAGILGVTPLFWIFAGRALTGAAAAAGLAMINSVGSLAGITGALITNVAKNVTGNVNSGTYVLGACLLLCCLLILLLPRAIVSADAPKS